MDDELRTPDSKKDNPVLHPGINLLRRELTPFISEFTTDGLHVLTFS